MKKNIFSVVGKEWVDYLKTESKVDKEKFEIEAYDFSDLLNCYEVWRKKETNKGVLDSYQTITKLLKKYKIPSLNENKIDEFVDELDGEYMYNGIFSSAMINELYKDDEIHLGSGKDEINYLGCYNEDKKIVIEGDCKYGAGYGMKSGEIIVKGNCGNELGSGMMGGEIKIYGDNFNPKEQISEYAEKGEIYHKDKLVWKDGKFIGDSI